MVETYTIIPLSVRWPRIDIRHKLFFYSKYSGRFVKVQCVPCPCSTCDLPLPWTSPALVLKLVLFKQSYIPCRMPPHISSTLPVPSRVQYPSPIFLLPLPHTCPTLFPTYEIRSAPTLVLPLPSYVLCLVQLKNPLKVSTAHLSCLLDSPHYFNIYLITSL